MRVAVLPIVVLPMSSKRAARLPAGASSVASRSAMNVWSTSSRTATWSIVPGSGTSIGKVAAPRSGIAPGEGVML